MNLFSLPSLIKIFFIILSSIYTSAKVLNICFKKLTYLFILCFSLMITPLVYYVQISIPLYTILVTTFLITVFCIVLFKRNIPPSLCISILSIGSSYVSFTIGAVITLPISFFLLLINIPETISAAIILLIIGVFQQLLIHLLFRTKRLKDGIPNITNAFIGDAGIYTGSLLILFSSLFFISGSLSMTFDLLLIAFILALGVIIWLWWQKSIQTDYINKNNSQQIDLLENKLQERDAELERLSKIIHKDNKLLAALELSTREILQDASSEKAESLLQELNRFSKERSETLHAYEAGQAALPKTGLFSIDTMLNYLHQRALKHRIAFQLSLEDEIAGITDIISEQDLCTIIADLGENAIIATKDVETKNIRFSIERKTDGYALYFYDSGEPFANEVLESFGKTRCTTHAETGGSGIGLVTTGELAAKYHGEFYITDEDVPQPYTKCVSVILKQGS